MTTPQDDGDPASPAGMSMMDWFASMYMLGERDGRIVAPIA